MDNLVDIHCSFVEYRLNDNSNWVITDKASYDVDIKFIKNMVNSKPFFEKIGGCMSIDMKKNRRFGMCVSKIVSVSICKSIKRIYSFNYNQARKIEDDIGS